MSTIIPAAEAAAIAQDSHNRQYGMISLDYLERIGKDVQSKANQGLWALTVPCKDLNEESLVYLVLYLTRLGYAVYWYKEKGVVKLLRLVWKSPHQIGQGWEVPDFNDPPSPNSPAPPIPVEEETLDPKHRTILENFLNRDDWSMGMSRKTTAVIREAIRDYLSTSTKPTYSPQVAYSPQVGNPRNLDALPATEFRFLIPDKAYLGWLESESDEAMVAHAILSSKLIIHRNSAVVRLSLTQDKLDLLHEALSVAGYSVQVVPIDGRRLVNFNIQW